jgi:hypothetical protein
MGITARHGLISVRSTTPIAPPPAVVDTLDGTAPGACGPDEADGGRPLPDGRTGLPAPPPPLRKPSRTASALCAGGSW